MQTASSNIRTWVADYNSYDHNHWAKSASKSLLFLCNRFCSLLSFFCRFYNLFLLWFPFKKNQFVLRTRWFKKGSIFASCSFERLGMMKQIPQDESFGFLCKKHVRAHGAATVELLCKLLNYYDLCHWEIFKKKKKKKKKFTRSR